MNLRRLTIADFTPGLPGPTRSSLDHSINFFARFLFASCLFVSLQTQRRFLTNSAPPLIAPSNHTLRTVEPNPFKDFGFFSTVSRTQVSRTRVPKTPVPKTRFWKLLKPSHNRLKTRVHQFLSHHWLRPSLASVVETHRFSDVFFDPAQNLLVSQFQNLVQAHLLIGRKNSQHMRCYISNCLNRPGHTNSLPRKFLSPQMLDNRCQSIVPPCPTRWPHANRTQREIGIVGYHQNLIWRDAVETAHGRHCLTTQIHVGQGFHADHLSAAAITLANSEKNFRSFRQPEFRLAAKRSTTMAPALCRVPRYSSPGFPRPTIITGGVIGKAHRATMCQITSSWPEQEPLPSSP